MLRLLQSKYFEGLCVSVLFFYHKSAIPRLNNESWLPVDRFCSNYTSFQERTWKVPVVSITLPGQALCLKRLSVCPCVETGVFVAFSKSCLVASTLKVSFNSFKNKARSMNLKTLS